MLIRCQISRLVASKGSISIWQRGLGSKGKKGVGGKQSGKSKRKNSSAKPREENVHAGRPRVPRSAASLKPQVAIPSAFLAPTGSSNVFIAKCAAEEFQIDPVSLFDEKTIPPSFRNAEFRYTSPKLFNHELPRYKIPEVAFLGRSNVGKSSLINSIMRRSLARASKRPGRTQTVHYYGLMPTFKNADADSPSAALGFLLDLPGYGFAKAPDKQVSEWQEMTQDFLLGRRELGTLQRLYLLVDARRGTSQFDRNIMGWFDEADIPYTLVLTKADRVGAPQLVRYTNEVCMRYHSQLYAGKPENGCQGPIVHVTSAKRNTGMEELMASVDADFTGYFADDEHIIMDSNAEEADGLADKVKDEGIFDEIQSQ